MANKEQVQSALNELYEKYEKTLRLLADSVEKNNTQETRIQQLEEQSSIEPSLDVNLAIPQSILDLEKTVLGDEQ
jgi:hypothetical protein